MHMILGEPRMNRRNFFGFAGTVAGAATLPAVAVASIVPSDKQRPPEVYTPHLVLHHYEKVEQHQFHQAGNSLSFPQSKIETSLSVSTGPDGGMWLRDGDGPWKRVVTE